MSENINYAAMRSQQSNCPRVRRPVLNSRQSQGFVSSPMGPIQPRSAQSSYTAFTPAVRFETAASL